MRASLALAVLLVAPSPVRSAVSRGGEWELIRSANGCAGEPSLAGGDALATQSCGEAFVGLDWTTAGADRLLSGYLSQIPSFSTAPSAAPDLSAGGVGLIPGTSQPLTLTFSDPLSSSTLTNAVSVAAVLDHLGNRINTPILAALSYNATGHAAALSPPAGGWLKGTVFEVYIASTVTDFNGLPFIALSTYSFMSPRDHTAPNVAILMADPKAHVSVPANAFNAPYFVALSSGNTASPLVADANAKLPALGAGRTPVSVLRADPLQETGSPWIASLDKEVVITLPYDDLNGDGLVDGTGLPIRTKTMSLWRLNEDQRLWVKQRAGALDGASRTYSFPSAHFSIYALIGGLDTDVSDVYAYPVPFRPNAGNPARYGCFAGCAPAGITFTNLPTEGTIRIYTLSGLLVRQLDIATNPQSWDVRNSAGEVVASGVYFYEVRSGQNRKTGKLMVIK